MPADCEDLANVLAYLADPSAKPLKREEALTAVRAHPPTITAGAQQPGGREAAGAGTSECIAATPAAAAAAEAAAAMQDSGRQSQQSSLLQLLLPHCEPVCLRACLQPWVSPVTKRHPYVCPLGFFKGADKTLIDIKPHRSAWLPLARHPHPLPSLLLWWCAGAGGSGKALLSSAWSREVDGGATVAFTEADTINDTTRQVIVTLSPGDVYRLRLVFEATMPGLYGFGASTPADIDYITP